MKYKLSRIVCIWCSAMVLTDNWFGSQGVGWVLGWVLCWVADRLAQAANSIAMIDLDVMVATAH